MKIRPEHYVHLRDAIAALGVDLLQKHREFIVDEGRAKDIDKRLRWDALYMAKLTPFLCANVYPYADDTHVDTALRKIMAEIVKP